MASRWWPVEKKPIIGIDPQPIVDLQTYRLLARSKSSKRAKTAQPAKSEASQDEAEPVQSQSQSESSQFELDTVLRVWDTIVANDLAGSTSAFAMAAKSGRTRFNSRLKLVRVLITTADPASDRALWDEECRTLSNALESRVNYRVSYGIEKFLLGDLVNDPTIFSHIQVYVRQGMTDDQIAQKLNQDPDREICWTPELVRELLDSVG